MFGYHRPIRGNKAVDMVTRCRPPPTVRPGWEELAHRQTAGRYLALRCAPSTAPDEKLLVLGVGNAEAVARIMVARTTRAPGGADAGHIFQAPQHILEQCRTHRPAPRFSSS